MWDPSFRVWSVPGWPGSGWAQGAAGGLVWRWSLLKVEGVLVPLGLGERGSLFLQWGCRSRSRLSRGFEPTLDPSLVTLDETTIRNKQSPGAILDIGAGYLDRSTGDRPEPSVRGKLGKQPQQLLHSSQTRPGSRSGLGGTGARGKQEIGSADKATHPASPLPHRKEPCSEPAFDLLRGMREEA